MTPIFFFNLTRLEERVMTFEDFEEITNAIYCPMNSTKFLGICEMWLSHGLG